MLCMSIPQLSLSPYNLSIMYITFYQGACFVHKVFFTLTDEGKLPNIYTRIMSINGSHCTALSYLQIDHVTFY